MIQATLTTRVSDDGGTFGDFFASRDDGATFKCETTERPPTGDHPCIPAWEGDVLDLNHPEHGMCYELQNVPGRKAILIHAANVWQQLLGCLALGKAVEHFGKNTCHPGMPPVPTFGVTESKTTLQVFMAFCAGHPIHLKVIR